MRRIMSERLSVKYEPFVQQLQDTEYLDISSIRDTRTGVYAKTPRNVSTLYASHGKCFVNLRVHPPTVYRKAN